MEETVDQLLISARQWRVFTPLAALVIQWVR